MGRVGFVGLHLNCHGSENMTRWQRFWLALSTALTLRVMVAAIIIIWLAIVLWLASMLI